MSSMSPEEIDRHVQTYIRVFLALMVLTVVTVVAAEFHLPVFWAVTVALVIASFKGSLVAAYFMHLKWEKRIVFATLALTAVLFLLLLLVPYLTSGTPPAVIHGPR
jgi:cytochrome c oxidase subunit 4